jgi:hypothetical protein
MSERPTPEQTQILIQFLQNLFQHVVGPMHFEVAAHLAVIALLKHRYPDLAPQIDVFLDEAHALPVLRESSQRQCHATLETLAQQVRQCSQVAATYEQMMQSLSQVKWN